MITDLIETTLSSDREMICLSAPVAEQVAELRDWLYVNVYRAENVEQEFDKASHVLKELFDYFAANPEMLNEHNAYFSESEPTDVAVTDFLAGMTDRYAMSLYQKLFFPQPWKAI